MSLTLTIQSFSYKKGIPTDESGNGGGFVFDCRGIYNPGRVEAYQKLSGLDAPVIKFLDELPDMQLFLKNTEALVHLTINNYLVRDFEHLQVCFGCTGGQHRSVYATEKLAENIVKAFPQIKIIKQHTNQPSWMI